MSKKKLYFDMEWVPISISLENLKTDYPKYYEAFIRRVEKWKTQDKFVDLSPDEIYNKEAGFFPEFIKIISISFGFFNNNGELKIDSIYGHDELEILTKTKELLDKVANKYILCGHSIKRFDMPYLAKRMAINGLQIPFLLNVGDLKPWEQSAVDIAEVWGFGVRAEMYTPLDWICMALDIDTSKSGDITGKDVSHAYWNDNRLEDIKDYCEADVKATAYVDVKMNSYINPKSTSN